jgi:vancomycin permeability regulator SanA
MKPNSNFKMNKELKILLSGLSDEKKYDYKREMIKAIIAPRIEFKKKAKDKDEAGTN